VDEESATESITITGSRAEDDVPQDFKLISEIIYNYLKTDKEQLNIRMIKKIHTKYKIFII